MKAINDFFIPDNEVRLHEEFDGGCVCEVPERVDGSLCSDDANDACGFDILRGRMGVIMCAVVLMLFSWLMVSCSESEGQKALNHVESVIEAHPDSALTLLRGVNKASLGSDKEKAQHALLMSMALDKNYIDTTTFDVIQPAIDYYLERDKGTPDDKLKTYYYQGRIFDNRKDRDKALNCFAKALDNTRGVNDSLCIARTLVAQAELYHDCYNFDVYTNSYLDAAKIYKNYSYTYYEFDCLLKALNGAIILEDKHLADSVLNLCNTFSALDERQQQNLEGYKISYLTRFGSKKDLAEVISGQESPNIYDVNGLLNIALALHKLGENEKAIQILNSVAESGIEFNSLKFQAIQVAALKELKDFEGAFSVYWDYIHKVDSINAVKFEQTTKTIEEKHDLELQAQKDARQKDRIIWGCIGLAMLLCIVVLIYFLHVKRLKVEHTNDLLKIQNLQNNLFERDRRQEEVSGKIESLFSTRFKLLDGLASSYFECKETGQEQKRIYSEVKNSLSDFSSDATTQELTDVVNGYKNGLMEHFKSDYPKLSASQCRLALYLFCGFSLPSISIFIGTDLRNLYVYKSRLKSVIAKGDSPRKEEYLKYFA